MRVFVVGNRADGDPGWVGEHLETAYGASLIRGWREEPDGWPDLDGFDLVVALGSDWSAYWDHVSVSVGAEMALMRAAQRQNRPLLGICFGAQVAAQALGGRVERAPEPEVGWYAVEITDAAPFDRGPWFQWHADRFEPPVAAQVLGHSPRAVQAFALGRTLAVQFHPEVTTAMVERWASGDGLLELQRLGIDRDELLDATVGNADDRRLPACSIVDAVLGRSAA